MSWCATGGPQHTSTFERSLSSLAQRMKLTNLAEMNITDAIQRNTRNLCNLPITPHAMCTTRATGLTQWNSQNSCNSPIKTRSNNKTRATHAANSTLATLKLTQLAQHNRINATYFISWIFHTANRPTSTTTQHLCFSFTYTFCLRQLKCADNWKTRNLDWRNWRWGSFEMQLI